MKSILKFLIGGYLLMIFSPYIFCLIMYLILKRVAEKGSMLERKLNELEQMMIDQVIQLIKETDFKVILLNVVGLIILYIVIYFFKKYKKLVIPNLLRRKFSPINVSSMLEKLIQAAPNRKEPPGELLYDFIHGEDISKAKLSVIKNDSIPNNPK